DCGLKGHVLLEFGCARFDSFNYLTDLTHLTHLTNRTMQIRFSPNQNDYQKLCTDGLRSNFLIETLFAPGKVELVYSDADRAIIGSAVPSAGPLMLVTDAELRAAFFCERRELGVLNIGGSGTVEVDGKKYEMNKLDCLYVGRGSKDVSFSS